MDASSTQPRSPTDVLLSIRGRITARTGMIAAGLILPFCLFHFSQGRYALAAMDCLAALIFGCNAWALMVRDRPILPYPMLVAALSLAVLGSVHFIGGAALHWSFPATMFFYMVLPRRQAHWACTLFLLTATGLAYLHLGLASCLRFAVTAGLTLLLLNVVLGLLGELQQRLIEQSLTDPLTGALNRRGLENTLQQLTDPANVDPQAVLLSFDVDHFKAINDNLGHAAGDDVLRQVVNVAKAGLRRKDLLYRIGGEEFVVVLTDINPDDALRLAEDLRKRIGNTVMLPQGSVTVSIGVSAWQPGLNPDRWLGAVDAAMYQAKQTGRNRVVMAEA
jgi:diguanylate cyclase (GGDEF)-like protein